MEQKEKRSKIFGISFEDENGTKRQDNCRLVVEGQKLFVVKETDNPFDPTAMKLYVDAELRLPLGYVQRELARDMQQQEAAGWSYEIFADKRTGGLAGKATGINIRIVATKKQV